MFNLSGSFTATQFADENNWERIDLDKELHGEIVTFNPDGNIRPLSKSLVEGDIIYSIGTATQTGLYDSNNTSIVSLTPSSLPYTVTQTIPNAGSVTGGELLINGELNNPVLRPTDIVDGLTSTDAKKVLSAKQGKILKEKDDATNLIITNLSQYIKGKVSIIGDSISTFDGYVPYTSYYPNGNDDVDTVEQTWWNKLISFVGGTLKENLSNSNSCVDSFYLRASTVINPSYDTVLIALGTNDYILNRPLGEYDYESDISDLSTSTFRTAYIKGIKELLRRNPTGKIVCVCFYMGNEYQESIRAIADHYGLDCIDSVSYFNGSNIHPDADGMMEIFNDIVRYYAIGDELYGKLTNKRSLFLGNGNKQSVTRQLQAGDVITDISNNCSIYDGDSDTTKSITRSILPYVVEYNTVKYASGVNGAGVLVIQGSLDDNLKTTDVVNNLTSTDTKKPLSANQGRVLNNKIPVIVNNLTTDDATKALSAKQGRNLNDRLIPVEEILNGKTLEFRADGSVRTLPEPLENGNIITSITTTTSLYNGDTQVVSLNSSMLPYTVSTTIDKASAYIAGTGVMASITVAGEFEDVLKESDVIDNLNSIQAKKPLSAKQGKILKDAIDGKDVTFTPNGSIQPLSSSLQGGDIIVNINAQTSLYTADSNTAYVTLTLSDIPYTVPDGVTLTRAASVSGGVISLYSGVQKGADIGNFDYAVCSTDAATRIKVVSVQGKVDYNTMRLLVQMPANTADNPLLKIGNLPDLQIRYNNNVVTGASNSWPAGRYMLLPLVVSGFKYALLYPIKYFDEEVKQNSKNYITSGAVYEALQNIQPAPETIKIGVPDVINAVVGDTYQIYFESIFLCNNYTNYDIGVTCNIGHLYPRYYEVTPTASQVGNHTITFTIKDNNNNLLGTKQCTLVVSAKATSPQNSVDVLCVGSSLSSPGKWEAELKRRLTGSGGTPVADGLSNINFIGRINKTIDGTSINFEATGGYGIRNYIQTGMMLYKFNFTAQSPAGACSIGDVYSINTRQYTITEINLTEGVGNISCTSESTAEISGSGTLTKVSGSGADTLSYSSSYVSGNPFVHNGAIDFQWYADTYGNGKIDVVSISEMILSELVNFGDNSQYITDFSAIFTRMQTFMDNVLADFPNCKFVVWIPSIVDARGGLGANYVAGQYMFYGIKTSLINLVQALENYISTNNLENVLYLINTLGETDYYNDFLQTNKKVNPRSNVTEIVGTNGFHPSDVGYMQFADSAYRCFVANLL